MIRRALLRPTRIWSGVHTEGSLAAVVRSTPEHNGKSVLITYLNGVSGRLGGCNPGSGSRGLFSFTAANQGGQGSIEGDMRVSLA